MLFNSYPFLLIFLPVVIVGFYLLGKLAGKTAATAWLTLSSLFFYAYWYPPFLLLLLAHIVGNYGLGRLMLRKEQAIRKVLCIIGVGLNLLVLGYFKYALFVLEIISPWTGRLEGLPEILLPIGLSFHTFQQIAYLCDTCKDPSRVNYRFLDYAFLIAFFPQLVAGPIVHHNELLPQLKNDFTRWKLRRFAPGIALFLMGLCKKAVFADRVAPISNLMFDAAANGSAPGCIDAWIGVSAYSLQLYFDFSGYSDMACGLALMFNFRLPTNFNSPYKSHSLVDFWRRWHMTLSRFLRDYLYIPMGGSRGTAIRTSLTLMVTMLIGGLWHGAGWTFIVWGGLHGLGLIVNHAWRNFRKKRNLEPAPIPVAWTLTLIWVAVAWVFFRSKDLASAKLILSGMIGLNPSNSGLWITIKDNQFALLGVLWLIVLVMPNTQQWLRRYCPLLDFKSSAPGPSARWHPAWIMRPWGAFCLGILFILILLEMPRVSEFIYFQF